MKKVTITIGIPVYNEERNIKDLIHDVLTQSTRQFSIKEIIIISDGSEDKTAETIKSIKNRKLMLIEGKSRKGKIKRMNELMSKVTTDILILFDGDVRLKNKSTVYYLAEKCQSADLVLGNHLVEETDFFISRVATIGVNIWREAINNMPPSKNIKYRCTGHTRAFSRKLYTQFRLPSHVTSGEDIYSFFYAISNKYSVLYAPKSVVTYHMAYSFREYLRQMSRFINASRASSRDFNSDVLSKYETMSWKDKLAGIAITAKKTPINLLISYGVLQTLTRIYAQCFYKEKRMWDIAYTSK